MRDPDDADQSPEGVGVGDGASVVAGVTVTADGVGVVGVVVANDADCAGLERAPTFDLAGEHPPSAPKDIRRATANHRTLMLIVSPL